MIDTGNIVNSIFSRKAIGFHKQANLFELSELLNVQFKEISITFLAPLHETPSHQISSLFIARTHDSKVRLLTSYWVFVSCSSQSARNFIPGGGPIWNRRGCSSEILNLKETIWAWLKLFVTPKGDESGRGLSKF